MINNENTQNKEYILSQEFTDALAEAIRIGAEAGVRAAFEDREKPLLKGRQAAKLAGIGKTKWYQMNTCGQILAPINSTKPYLWNKKELLQWIDAGRPNRMEWERMCKEVY